MLIEIGCGSEMTRADLKDGTVKVGGGPKDEVRIPGLPPSLLTLRIEGERLTVTSSETLSIGKSMFPSHLPRLLIAGEVVQLSRLVTLRQVAPPRRTRGTATMMRDLLGGGTFAIEQTRAATLTCLTGADAGNVIPIAFESMLIGRGDDCTLQIRDRSVSRRHARLVQRDGRVFIEDLRGANGTWVNGEAVLRKAPLQPGDVVELGQTLLRFDACSPDEPTPSVEAPPSVLVDEALVTEPAGLPSAVPAAAARESSWVLASLAGGAIALGAAVFAAASLLR